MGKGKRARIRRAELAVATTPQPAIAERHGFDGGMLGHEAGTYTVNVTEQVALAVDAVFACVRLIADLTADADVLELRGTERLDPSRLVRRPMSTITRRTWLWTVAATMALYNGCYYRRVGTDSDGVPLSLVPIAPSRVGWDNAGSPRIDGVSVDLSELGWIPRTTWPTVTRELGSVLRLARETVAAAWAADSYRADFWEHGGAPVIVLTTDQELTNTQADDIADRWVTKRAESPGKPAVVGKGATAKPLGADAATDGAANATDKLGASVARYFGVPAWLVNVPSQAGSLTYSNAASAGLDLVRYTLRPGYAGPIADALSDELPGDSVAGRRVELSLRHLTLGTTLEQFQAYAIATGNQPWMQPFEVRDELAMPRDMALAGTPAPQLPELEDIEA